MKSMMTKRQIEEFAVGYPYPTDYVEVILKKYDFNKDKAHEVLCKPLEEVVIEIQNYSKQSSGCDCCQGDEALYWKDNENNAFVDSKGDMLVTVKDKTLRFKVKRCPNCGKEF